LRNPVIGNIGVSQLFVCANKYLLFDTGIATGSPTRAEGRVVRKAAIYLRVSTQDQTTANQERELRAVAERMGIEIAKVYRDHGISGAKGRDKRPDFDRLSKDAARRQFDIVMAWSVDRLGRSLQDLVGFLSEIHSLKIDLYLHQQGLGPVHK
jgi:DNA invertase Pin-like site-specific DNA recombinase